ncbi:parallel beta-helix repeat protein [Methanococcus voltae]|uniref:Ig-like domain-containing protein n=1 Tax=Methanococcus voltae TaxID=2188 RepID=UPI001AEA0FDA|nr:Ig-like domain-containing protein [Methanococcus voltae]MBP2144542.1 parallel beta-helix repeat protein [Methanococcus voltae]
MKQLNNKKTIFLVLISLLSLIVSGVSAYTAINEPTVINTPGIYYLNNSILCSNETCINITCSNVTLYGNTNILTGYNSSTGILVRNPDYTITNVTIKEMNICNFTDEGILLDNVEHSTLKDNEIKNIDNIGVWLLDSHNNTLFRNNISNNHKGIYVEYSHNNSIYNNLFNNTDNIYFYYGEQNYLNTSKENGGGNYWFTPNGTGFSENYADKNNDGFCDEVYNISLDNIDYLPICAMDSTQSVNESNIEIIINNPYDRQIFNNDSVNEIFINATVISSNNITSVVAELNGVNNTMSKNYYYSNIDVYYLLKNLTGGDYTLKVYATDSLGSKAVSNIKYFKVNSTLEEFDKELLWKKTFGNSEYNFYPKSVDSDDSGIYVVGRNGKNISLLRYDTEGNLIWNRTKINNNYPLNSVLDNNYIYTTSQIWYPNPKFEIITYDKNGKFLWNKTFNGYCNNITILDNYIFTISNVGNSNDKALVKIDKNGNSLWNKTIYGINNTYIKSVDSDNKNVYFSAISYGYNGTHNIHYTQIFKYDIEGNQIWNKTIDYINAAYESSSILNNYGLYIFDHEYINSEYTLICYKFDKNGNSLWNKTYKDNSWNFKVDSDDNYIYILTNDKLLKIDNDGNLIWYEPLADLEYDTAISVDSKSNIYIMNSEWNSNPSYSYMNLVKYGTNNTINTELIINKPIENEILNTDSLNASINLKNLSEGTHNLTIKDTDRFGRIVSKNVIYIVDTTAPEIIINSPMAGKLNNSNILINVTSTDANNVKTVIAEVNGTNITLTKSGDYYIGNTTLEDGTYTLKVYSEDEIGNSDLKTVTFTVDTTIPLIVGMSLLSPQDNSTISNKTLEFVFNVTGSEENYNCTLYLNNNAVATNISVLDGVLTSFVIENLTDGEYNWYISATAENIYNVSENWIFKIDTVAPNITIIKPTSEVLNNSIVEIVVNATDSTTGVREVIAEIDGINITLDKIGDYYIGNTTLADGDYTLKVYAYDNVGNYDLKTVYLGIDTTLPTEIIIINPKANSTVGSNLEGNIYLTNLAEGSHNITITDTDSSGNYITKKVSYTVNATI